MLQFYIKSTVYIALWIIWWSKCWMTIEKVDLCKRMHGIGQKEFYVFKYYSLSQQETVPLSLKQWKLIDDSSIFEHNDSILASDTKKLFI
jgi:hypothetical protein